MLNDVFGIVGSTLAGTFLIEGVIAEGGFGVVYRAEHVAFRAPVALKCLKVPSTITPAQTEAFVENFREEAEILFHLSAQIPEVVRPLHADAFRLDDGTVVPYLAMEWIDGKPLDSIVIMRFDAGRPPLSLRRLLDMLTPIAHALNKAHRFEVPGGGQVSITHCDLKPENIVITEPDNPIRAKILDFGIAKARDTMRQQVGRVTDGETANPFTPAYGAPEQWVPKRFGQSGPWTDVWGLALTLVECLTGRPPIDGDMHAMMGTALDASRRPTPRNEGAKVSQEVESVFERALAVDPRQRYHSVEDFWSDLEQAAGAPESFIAEPAPSRRALATTPAMVGTPALGPGLGSEPPELIRGVRRREQDFELELPQSAPPVSHSSADFDPFDEYAEEDQGADSTDVGPFASDPRGAEEFSGELELVSLAPQSRAGPIEPAGAVLDRDDAPPAAGAGPAGPSRSGLVPAESAGIRGTGRQPVYRGQPAERTRELARKAVAGELRDLKTRLRVPVLLLVVGLVITLVDLYIARSTGEGLGLGPVRARWVAGGMAVVGIALVFWAIVTGDRE